MNLNVNSNMNAIGGSWPAGAAQPGAQMPKSGVDDAKFTITHAVASPEDVVAAEIPDAALSRDDALGRLVSAAFNLPPPPMPWRTVL